jgi:5'-nucleotidase
MRFLLTNDDGFDAPGLAALAEAARELGELHIVAPNVELSGCSHRVTVDRPLTVQQLEPRLYRIDGTPADCVRVALGHLRLEVDWVLSGINPGGNLGADVWMSGTVAAVREAALWRVPGIALSQYRRSRGPVDWPRATGWAKTVLKHMLGEALEPGRFWNVNFPDPPESPRNEVPSIRECTLDSRPLDVRYEAAGDQVQYRGRYRDRPHEAETDVDHCFRGSIAVSKLQV